MELIKDLKKLAAAIKANGGAHLKVDAQWQLLACSAISAFAEHGNVFYINQVWKSLGKGARHNAMTQFFLTHGGVKANTGEGKDETPFVKDSDKKPNLENAIANPWFDMVPSKKPDEVVDYLALILKAAKKSPKDGQTTTHADFREKVLALANEYAAAEDGAVDPLKGITS